MTSAFSWGSWLSSRLASAAAFLRIPNARITGTSPGEAPRADPKVDQGPLRLCAPQRQLAGTSTGPRESVSVRVCPPGLLVAACVLMTVPSFVLRAPAKRAVTRRF